MQTQFRYKGAASEVFFGFDVVEKLKQVLVARNIERAVLLTTPQASSLTAELQKKIELLMAGQFKQAAMHTPVDVTEAALKVIDGKQADAVISFGGGSSIGLGKAIRHRRNVLHIAIPTTYAGSEATAILGQTENGQKVTLRDDRLVPEVIIYDPALALSLPKPIRANSAMNAIAHAVEGLYAQDRNPLSSIMAIEGIKAFATALPVMMVHSDDMTAQGKAQYGAWLCGCVLNAVGMALHHKICHTLGGSFDLPHAEVHAIMLPYTLAYNASAAASELSSLRAFFGDDIASGLKSYSRRIGAAQALVDIGMTMQAIPKALAIALNNPYWNPAPLNEAGLKAMLEDAQIGAPPRAYGEM